jgi:hypothetical protein
VTETSISLANPSVVDATASIQWKDEATNAEEIVCELQVDGEPINLPVRTTGEISIAPKEFELTAVGSTKHLGEAKERLTAASHAVELFCQAPHATPRVSVTAVNIVAWSTG